MIDRPSVVIASVPYTDSQSPVIAPAVLKASLSTIGIDSRTIDLNAEVRQHIIHHPCLADFVKFFTTEQIDRSVRDNISQLIDLMADRILETEPDWILLSLLTYLSQIPTRWLCFRLRQKKPSAKIVIGGPGAFAALQSLDTYADTLKKQDLIDFYVRGDGELSVRNLLLGLHDDSPGIDQNEWQQLDDLNNQPYPNFDDYNWNLYKRKLIVINGSRGCVRKCTFCDIHEHWSKYQWRTGKDIFSEMLYQFNRHKINFFSFSDSLVNGNQKEFNVLLELLTEQNKSLDESDRIRWTGSFIIRPRDQMKESTWKLLADSGATILSAGVESFVEHIRYHIGKKFSNDDLKFALEMAAKYNIQMQILILVGYITETEDDFKEQLEWIKNNRHFAGNSIVSVLIGSGLAILPGTWLDRNYQKLNVRLNDNSIRQDWIREEIQSTPEVRMRWHQQMQDCLRDHGFAVEYMKDNHVLIEQHINAKYYHA